MVMKQKSYANSIWYRSSFFHDKHLFTQATSENILVSLVPARKCSRFQFECRSTGECIAIYNACDGIPQCADGSDEAPELGCPDLVTTPLPAPVANNPPVPVRYDTNVSKRNSYHSFIQFGLKYI